MNDNFNDLFEDLKSDTPQANADAVTGQELNAVQTEAASAGTTDKKGERPKRKRKKSSTRMLLILGAALTVICICVAIGLGVYFSQPEVVVTTSVSNFLSDLIEREEIAPIIDMMQGGSLEAEFSIQPYDTTIQGKGKLYFTSEELYLENGSFGVGGAAIDASAYLGSDYFYVASDELLDDAYGFKKGNLCALFDDSIFASDSGSDFALDEQSAQTLRDLLAELDDTAAQKELQDDVKEIGERYCEILIDAFKEYALFEEENKNVKVGDERIEARVITVTLDQTKMLNIMRVLYEELREDEKVKALVIQYGQGYAEYMYGPNMDIAEAWDNFLEEFAEELDETEDADFEFSYIFELVTPKHSSDLLQCTLTYKSEDYKYEYFKLDVGSEGIKKSQKMVLELDGGEETFEFEVTQSDNAGYAAQMKHEYMGWDWELDKRVQKQETIFKFTHSKENNTFRLNLFEGEIILKGKLEVEKSTTTIELEELTIDEEEYDCDVRAVIKRKDKLPDVLKESEFVHILEIGEDELNEAFNKLYDFVETVEDAL